VSFLPCKEIEVLNKEDTKAGMKTLLQPLIDEITSSVIWKNIVETDLNAASHAELLVGILMNMIDKKEHGHVVSGKRLSPIEHAK
jgi:hypothetical protein